MIDYIPNIVTNLLYAKKLEQHIQNFHVQGCLNRAAINRINVEFRKLLKGHFVVALYLALIGVFVPSVWPIYFILLLLYPFDLKMEINYFIDKVIFPYTYGETTTGQLIGVDFHWPRGGNGMKISFEFTDHNGNLHCPNVYSLDSELFGIDDLYIVDILGQCDVIDVIFCLENPAKQANFFNPEMFQYYSLDSRRIQSA